MKKILAVFAHPDDETFICGGTLAKYAKQGAEITLVCATMGEMGRRVGNPPVAHRETLPLIRERELKAACKDLGIRDLRFLHIRDKMVEYEDVNELAGRVLTVMKEVSPQVVITFSEQYGGHSDHCFIGKSTMLAYHQYDHPASLYFVSLDDITLHPEYWGLTPGQIKVIDIREDRREKMNAFRSHLTQSKLMNWLWEDDNQVIEQFGVKEFFFSPMPIRHDDPGDLFQF